MVSRALLVVILELDVDIAGVGEFLFSLLKFCLLAVFLGFEPSIGRPELTFCEENGDILAAALF